MFQGRRYRPRPDTPPEQEKSSSASSTGGRSATNISSLTAASSLARGRIHTALETQPADPRRLKSSRTPTDDGLEPTTHAERRRALIRMNREGKVGRVARSGGGASISVVRISQQRGWQP